MQKTGEIEQFIAEKKNLSQKSAQSQLFALAHSQISQNVFIRKNHLRGHWKALSKGLATGLSKFLKFESIGLYTGFSAAYLFLYSQNVTILGLKLKMSFFAPKIRSNVKNNTRNVFLAQNRTYWLFLLYNFLINMSYPQ